MKVVLAAAFQINDRGAIPLYGGLGPIALAAAVKQRNYDCHVVDLVRYGYCSHTDIKKTLEEAASLIIDQNPDIVGISNTTDSLIFSLEIAKTIKKQNPATCIVLGGPGVSYCAVELLENFAQIDYIIRGEADYAFPDFIDAHAGKGAISAIKGVVYRSGGTIQDLGWPDPVENLDDLPIPAYEFCEDGGELTAYFDKEVGFNIEAGRGCPYNCTFCSTSNFFQRKFRVKSVGRVLEEIEYAGEILNGKRIRLTHDLLTHKHDYLESLCEGIASRYPLQTWGCDARLDTVHPELIQKMAKSGCRYIFLGIEAGTPKMQKKIGKRLNLERLDETMVALKENNVASTIALIMGFPGEEKGDIAGLFDVILKTKSIAMEKTWALLQPLTPQPGSRLFDEEKETLVFDEAFHHVKTFVAGREPGLQKIIRRYPQIFTRFFSFQFENSDSYTQKESLDKYGFFPFIIEKILKYSIIYAYRQLDPKKYTEELVEVFFESSLKSSQFSDMELGDYFENLRRRTLDLFGANKAKAEIFKSILDYEVAASNAIQMKKTGYIQMVDTNYTEKELIEFVTHPDNPPPSPKKRRLLVYWDTKSQKTVALEMDPQLAELVS